MKVMSAIVGRAALSCDSLRQHEFAPTIHFIIILRSTEREWREARFGGTCCELLLTDQKMGFV